MLVSFEVGLNQGQDNFGEEFDAIIGKVQLNILVVVLIVLFSSKLVRFGMLLLAMSLDSHH